MIKFVPYDPEHFIQMANSSAEGDTGFIFSTSARFHANHPATTAMADDGFPVATFGITPLWNGVSEVWAMFDKERIRKHGVFMVKATKAFLDDQMKTHHRLQCFVYANNESLVKFVENFGFEREGLMRKYGPTGEDFYMYARVS